MVAAYLLVAYVVLPQLGKRNAQRHPDLLDGARLTHTGSGLPGDPLNIALVGSEEEVIRAMIAAGWRPANPLSFRSSVRIVVDTVLAEPDPNAPVSNLYLFGRKEDLAFEKPVGHSPRERHHVRFWRSEQLDDGRPMWMGAATHDVGVELSRTTAQVTHRISPEVDTERDLLLADLTNAQPAARHALDCRLSQGTARPQWRRRPVAHRWPAERRDALTRAAISSSSRPHPIHSPNQTEPNPTK